MNKLEENGYISFGKKKELILTESGRAEAKRMLDRHLTLTNILVSLGVTKEIAAIDACKLEHDLSEESYKAIKKAIGK